MPDDTTLKATLADLREQWCAANGDDTRRNGVIEDAMTRLFAPAPDTASRRRAAIEAALETPDDDAALAALGVREARPLNSIPVRLPVRLLAASGKGGAICRSRHRGRRSAPMTRS